MTSRTLRQRPSRFARASAAALVIGAAIVASSCANVLRRQYEYEEELYLSLDGTATVYVNSSIPALVALRGLPLDTAPRARIDRAAVRAAYSSSLTTVTLSPPPPLHPRTRTHTHSSSESRFSMRP